MTRADGFHRAFAIAADAVKDVNAPPGLELADVAWPLVSSHLNAVGSALRHACEHGTIAAGETQAILNRLVYNLYTLLFGATSRAMVVEMAAAESTGLMQGDTPEERYGFFADMLGDASFCAQILAQYPVLEEQLLAICRNWQEASIELISRLDLDRDLIRDAFFSGRSPGGVAGLEASVGDVHRRGRSTCIVHFEGGSRVVYKPRPLAVDPHFRAFAEWINQKLGKRQILVPEAVDRGTYGWCAFVRHEPVGGDTELATYYERLGAILALAYLTGLADLHAENVIAHGAWPVLVDLEAVFRPLVKPEPWEGAARTSNRLLDQSVLATQLLAARATNDDDERLVDLGGIVDLAGQETLFKVPTWRNIGRVDARLDHALHPFEASLNMPVYENRRVSADLYGESIERGFAEVYRLLQSNRTVLMSAESPLAAFQGDTTRVVLRPTSLYARLLSASFHPDFLVDASAKVDYFRSHLKDEEQDLPGHHEFAAAEIDDLWQCDIPCFTMIAGSRELVSSQGVRLGMRARVSGLDLAYERLDRFGETDLARQCWLIGVMLARSDSRAGPTALPVAAISGPCDLRDRARSIAHTAAETICAQAIHDGDRTRATWHAVGEAAGVATVNDSGLDLYSGLPGIALFLCLAGRLLDRPDYGDMARCALHEILGRLDAPNPINDGVGGYVGSGGLAYALQQMAADFPDLDLGRRAVEVFLATDHESAGDIDLAYGLSGALMSCITLYRHCRTGTVEDRASADRLADRAAQIGKAIAERLADDAVSGGLSPGLAHGSAGIAAALARLFAETADARAGALARRLLNETAAIAGSDAADGSWCRGQAGLVLALGEEAGLLQDRRILEEALKHLAAQTSPKDHSLCHGAMGIVATLLHMRAHAERDMLPAVGPFVRDICDTGILCGTINSVVSPGLMDGLAGIGLGSLALLDPDAIPCVLALDGLPASPNRVRNRVEAGREF